MFTRKEQGIRRRTGLMNKRLHCIIETTSSGRGHEYWLCRFFAIPLPVTLPNDYVASTEDLDEPNDQTVFSYTLPNNQESVSKSCPLGLFQSHRLWRWILYFTSICTRNHFRISHGTVLYTKSEKFLAVRGRIDPIRSGPFLQK